MSLRLFLDTLRSHCEARKVPLISIETERYLIEYLHRTKPKQCVEIGAALGYSSIVIANEIHARWGQLTSFEVAYPSYLEALQHLQQAKIVNVNLFPFDITKHLNIQSLLPVPVDFVFIDGQKNQYASYLEKIQGNLGPENSIVLDDVIKYQMKLSSLYEFLEKNQINYKILPSEEGDGIMILENFHI